MSKRILLVLLLLGLVICPQVRAQGSSEAYFQWMNAITVSTPDIAGHLQFAGISDSKELEQAAVILARFKAEEFGLEGSYNSLPSTHKGFNDGTDEFLSRQASLVERTIGKLAMVLSKESMVRLSNRAQQEGTRNQKLNAAMSANHQHPSLKTIKFPSGGGGMGFYNVHYTFYTTYSLTPTGDGSGNANLVVIAQITGYTSCPNGCVGPVHQARVRNTLAADVYGPQLSPVSYMNVQNNQAVFEPFAAPVSPVPVTVGGEVDCTQVGDIAPFGDTNEDFDVEPAVVRLSRNPSNGATTVYATYRSTPCDYTGPAVVPSTWKDKHNNNDGPQGFEDWEAIGVSADGSHWFFPTGTSASSGKNVYGIYPPVLPDCTNSFYHIFPPTFPF